MNKELKAIQLISGIIVAAITFFYLKDIDYYGASGIGILWGIAAYLGVQAFYEWNKNRQLIDESKIGDSEANAQEKASSEPTSDEKVDNNVIPKDEWANIRSSLYVLRLKLEENKEPKFRKDLAQDFLKVVERYDEFISKHGENISEEEKVSVLEDLKGCLAIFKESGE